MGFSPGVLLHSKHATSSIAWCVFHGGGFSPPCQLANSLSSVLISPSITALSTAVSGGLPEVVVLPERRLAGVVVLSDKAGVTALAVAALAVALQPFLPLPFFPCNGSAAAVFRPLPSPSSPAPSLGLFRVPSSSVNSLRLTGLRCALLPSAIVKENKQQ